MKKTFLVLLCALIVISLAGCAGGGGEGETLQGTAEGYGGDLTVEVTQDGDDITAVEVVEHSETEGIGTVAIEQLPEKIVEADSVDVDSIADATKTSEAIKEAVKNALGE